jgi:type III pantothenate kinase
MRTLVLNLGNTSLFAGVFSDERGQPRPRQLRNVAASVSEWSSAQTPNVAASVSEWSSAQTPNVAASVSEWTPKTPLAHARSYEEIVARSVAGLTARFRVPIQEAATAHGFARLVARRVPGRIDRAALCSVVPALTASIARHIKRTFGVAPLVLTAAASHDLTIGYRRPRELGVDRLAAALGARELFPKMNVIVVDCGTATTVTALRRDGVLLGGGIFPGLALWADVLAARTAQLPRIALRKPEVAVGRSPREAIASGLYHGHAGAIRELIQRIHGEAFGRQKAVVIGTGGHAAHFAREKLFTVLAPDLILTGLRAFAARKYDHA